MKQHILQPVQSYLKSSEAYKAFRKNPDSISAMEGLGGYPLAVLLHVYQVYLSRRVWVICPTEQQAQGLYKDLKVSNIPSLFMSSVGKKLYSDLSGGDDEYQLIKDLQSLDSLKSGIVFVPIRTFVSPVPDAAFVSQTKRTISVNDPFDPTTLSRTFTEAGYYRSPSTSVPGEFSAHGEIFDFFPYDGDRPVRIHGDWDTVERITLYDSDTQDQVQTISSVTFHVLGETSTRDWSHLSQYFRDSDYFFLIGAERLETSFNSMQVEAKSLYREAFQLDRSSPKPHEILFDYHAFLERGKRLSLLFDVKGQHSAYQFEVREGHSYFGNFTLFKEDLTNLLANGFTVVIYAGSLLQKDRLSSMLQNFRGLMILPDELSGGFVLESQKLAVICDHEIFGRRKVLNRTLHKVQSSPLDSFVDLNEGDYVVHINYGIGQFEKIDRVNVAGRERDYIKILYGGKEYLFVPIEQANLVQRYIGSEGTAPRLDTLSGASWSAKKAKARKSAEKLAERLIALYAKRKNTSGYPFPKDTDWQLEFEASFPYDETEDQLQCVEDIKKDMESPIVMDRLICGDVGYGKTEIALRAAFKAVMAGKQVAFLAPTTILAEQHYETLLTRLGTFPVQVAMMSRIVDRKQQKRTLEKVSRGEIDILVGTHRILQKDILYRDLGLLIIDEEQRFGVKDKEKMKELKTNIDSIALSATPIPRTLYMSLLKIRDMSLLTTPPIQRRAIKTIIEEYDIYTVKKAIEHETARGGQVFYLHNRISSLDEVLSILQKELPHLIFDVVHGQMDARHIEDVMHRFVHEGIQVLISTTLIENGIDIPNVNTIIIDRADRYGVSQLYQLRGRVGRGDKDAYAYLFYPHSSQLSEIAIKRLKVISDHTELGSGFKIAMKDMEIRGTGNLLGREQSGQLASVGLDMYIRILDEEIARLTKEQRVGEEEVFLELDYSGFIPDEYISEPSVKFEIYKKIASVNSDEALLSLNGELLERFGPVPEVVANLMYIAELKVLCRKLGVYHLRERNGRVEVTFSKVKDISIDKVMQLMQLRQNSVKLDPKRINVLILTTQAISLKDKSLFILEMLKRLL